MWAVHRDGGPGLARAVVMPLLLLLLLAMAASPHLAAAPTDPAARDEAEATSTAAARGDKAAMLYKFLGYVDFPGGPLDPGVPYVVGVVGADDVADELARLALGRTVNHHGVVVRRLHDGDSARDVHLLFIGAGDGASEQALVKAAALAGAMSVTESATGIACGSVINFVLVDDRVRFEVSLAAAEKNKLKLSSRLLSVAHAVQKGGG
jgi:hypothetical protein